MFGAVILFVRRRGKRIAVFGGSVEYGNGIFGLVGTNNSSYRLGSIIVISKKL